MLLWLINYFGWLVDRLISLHFDELVMSVQVFLFFWHTLNLVARVGSDTSRVASGSTLNPFYIWFAFLTLSELHYPCLHCPPGSS